MGPQSRVFSQIGNAVPCKLAEIVAKAVKRSLLNEQSQPINSMVNKNFELELA